MAARWLADGSHIHGQPGGWRVAAGFDPLAATDFPGSQGDHFGPRDHLRGTGSYSGVKMKTSTVRGVHPENGDVDPKNGMGLLSSGSRRETVRWKAIAYSYPAH